ncbi:unnamed protein product [Durusdinium trenchii]|uniref:RRM domain-containing protein n=1 Tax=Durusdinium trenchii TaxID=1381693 RepID=A0ABP0PYK4_9DINO
MLVVGGRDSASTRYNDLWSYDPQSDSWSQLDNGSVFFCTLEVESSLGCNKQHAVHPPVICGGLQEKPLETVPLGQIVAGACGARTWSWIGICVWETQKSGERLELGAGEERLGWHSSQQYRWAEINSMTCCALRVDALRYGTSDSWRVHFPVPTELGESSWENGLRQVFGWYGDIVSLEHIDEGSGGSAMITYNSKEAAQEAAEMVHLASIRGKTCRCLLWSQVEAIWKTMDTGHRLQLEGLDLKISSQSLQDMFSLFGPVLDCKVQMDEDERSRGYGFVHFAEKEHALKATELLNGMQIGKSNIQVRPSRPQDLEAFTGCLYSLATTVSAVCPPPTEWMPMAHEGYGGHDGYGGHEGLGGGWEEDYGNHHWEPRH